MALVYAGPLWVLLWVLAVIADRQLAEYAVGATFVGIIVLGRAATRAWHLREEAVMPESLAEDQERGQQA